MKKIVLLIFILSFLKQFCLAQKTGQLKIDSLLIELKKAKEDTGKVNIINKISDEYDAIGEFAKEFNYGVEGLAIAKKINYRKGAANCFINIGNAFWYQSNYSKALENYLASLKINEEIGNKKGIAYSYLCIGDIYLSQGNFEKALENNLISVKTNEKIGNKKGISEAYNDRAVIYFTQGNYDKALETQLLAQKFAKEIGYNLIVGTSYNIIGNIYQAQNNNSKALENYLSALQLFEDLGNKNSIATSYFCIGNLFLKENKNDESRNYLEKAMKLSKEIGSKEIIKNIYEINSDLAASQNNYKSAFENYKLFIIYKDSTSNIESAKKTLQSQMQFDFDKKQLADSLYAKSEKEKIQEVAKVESKKQKLITFFIALGLLFALTLASLIFRSLRIRNKQNKIITIQKSIVEEKQREITDSISYALRIQNALLPPQKLVKQYLKNSFILYKPKDIVAGDFYWMELINDKILFAACDCTGHGVPGAMVSIVCHNALNRAVREFGLSEPAAILDKTTEIVIENFAKSEENIKDGMDISLCAYNIKTNQLEWSGANNSLWIIQNGHLLETKADKQPIGVNENNKPFTNHLFTLNTGDTIYLFTDGFADQFGGEKGKKFMSKNLRELLAVNAHLPMQEQKKLLDKAFTEWIGNIEQIDDVTLIGVRV
jgi:serine phosphatase RsbU (regulator of sigma subunit)